ncbi:LPS-assembly protein LptD [Roseovarius indicus]|uniref:LPS-assembly protein LptD n=1 Tax=Roseovarius indicus TaxID=540747 RepID=A0A0T5PA09_9RHOB|nr:LPS assembly protein LptD [Roseovarius indicus]KRS17873.1 organic solvent tolerance protein [Roseovarius indicus]QEW27321.1 Organic solvent tolerance protein [Roseovarius indicus]SFD50359.1 LPS-assembly protein [Roseovarius indicus]
MRGAAAICLLVLVMALARPGAATAQAGTGTDAPPPPAVLVADDVYMEGNERLVATGNVEALYDGTRLQAEGIIYDRAEDKLILSGPIVIHEGGESVILASSGEMDKDLRAGILRGARIVMGDHVQLAAQELNRSAGRYNQLVKVSVTSCRVCETGRPPLWQIRARRVIHDQEEKQLYFEDAQFRVMDTPIFYLPRLRLPDPSLERSTGFLVPSLYNSSLLGTGLRVPYFIRIGDHKDLTVTPFITSKSSTLELRYRQAFRNGRIEFEGAISDDNLGSRSRRGYIFGEGEFTVLGDYTLRFDIETVNDDTYLLDYSYYEKDRLDSELEIERAKRDSYVRGAITYFHSLRVGEQNSTLPTLVTNAEWERRIHPNWAGGGEIRLGMLAHSHIRSSGLISDGPDIDVWADGRDVGRMTVSADWLRNWTLPGGVLAHVRTGVAIDHFEIRQAGLTSLSEATEVSPTVELELRWPLLNAGNGRATHVVEPIVQFSWVGGSNPFIPNDESTRIEFDEGNLFSTSRFTAPDRRERGMIAAYGVSWTRFDPTGLQTSLAMGQLVRDEIQLETNGLDSFTSSSGLNGKVSDVLVAGQVKTGNGLVLTARGLFDDTFNTTKAEARASWQNSLASLSATYIWLGRDLAESRATTISEWAFDASYRLSRHWTGSANWRYDVASDDSVRAGLGVTYTNECVEVRLAASRRFTSSTILAPSTDISLTVGLRGFTTKTSDKSYVRSCNN